MWSILSIIGIFILAALKLEQFVYGKSGKEQSTTGHIARRGVANLAGLIAFDYAISSKTVVVKKKKKDAQKWASFFFFYLHRKNLEKYIDKFKNNTCYFKWLVLLYRQR